MVNRKHNLNIDFVGTISSCLDQYVKGKINEIEVINLLEHKLPKGESKKNWDPKSEFKGHELIETFLDVKGMTQAELAKKVGLSTSKINDLIRGRVSMTPRTAKKLADVFEVEHTAFL